MDRNTLLAFFLIALVLLFTPKYMEIFSPQKPVTKREPTGFAGESQTDSLVNLSDRPVFDSTLEDLLVFEETDYKQTLSKIETFSLNSM